MRGKSASEPASAVSPMTLIVGAGGCFALGFAALMLAPLVLHTPRYVATPVQEDSGHTVPAMPTAVVTAAPAISSPLVQEIHAAAAPSQPQAISRLHTLADLSECKGQIATGGSYNGVGQSKLATLVGANRTSLTNQQIDEGCRKLLQM